MRVLVVDSTPHTLSYDLIATEDSSAESQVRGELTRIGSASPEHLYVSRRGRAEGVASATDHREAFRRVAAVLASPTTGPDNYADRLVAVTHRIPHGGDEHEGLVPLTSELQEELMDRPYGSASGNQGALAGLCAAQEVFCGVPQLGVFDTMPACSPSMLYALPEPLRSQYRLRRYCPHSISHRRALALVHDAAALFPAHDRVMTLHIGAETSAAAFFRGELVDTSGGLNLYSGLPGTTACGTIDAGAIAFLLRQPGMDLDRLEQLLAYESGLEGMSGCSAQLTTVLDEAERGDVRCRQAVDVFAASITRAIGALTATLEGLDVLVFTGPVASSSGRVRELICDRLGFLGLELDTLANDNVRRRGEGTRISTKTSTVALGLCFGSDAQHIARQSASMVSGANSE